MATIMIEKEREREILFGLIPPIKTKLSKQQWENIFSIKKTLGKIYYQE